jgi:hypothetical protein
MGAIVDNGYVNEAGVHRRFPERDDYCSTDHVVTNWVEYADGTVFEFDTLTDGSDGGLFTDLFGNETPHPWYFTVYEDGIMVCEFFGT